MNHTYFSNSIGAVVPLPDSASPLLWNPLWLPISKKPPTDSTITPLSTGRFLIGEPENNTFHFTDETTFNYNDVFVRMEELLASHPELKKVLVGFYLTTVIDETKTPHQYFIQYNIYITNNATKQIWENWKLSAQANPNQINGLFYIYRPWYNNSPNPIPLRQDKVSLLWQVPTTGLPSQQKITGISWSCPTRPSTNSSQVCGQPNTNQTKYPLTYRGLRKTNRPTDPCFLQEEGCIPGAVNLTNPTCIPNYDNHANSSCNPNTNQNKVYHGSYNIDLPFAHDPSSVSFNPNNKVSPNEYDFLFQPLS